MESWRAIRESARAQRDRVEAVVADGDADEVARAVAKLRKLKVRSFTPGREGYRSDLRAYYLAKRIGVSDLLTPEERAAETGHELGHAHLHDDRLLEDEPPQPPRPDGRRRLSGYAPRQTKERQAWLYSDELLCSSSRTRTLLASGRRTSDVARESGLPIEVVRRQAVRSLLRGPDDERDLPSLGRPTLDPEQSRCEGWSGGPLLVQGGAGSGKTAVLAARVRILLSTGVKPTTLLVVVSTPAAAEAIERDVTQAHPDALGKAWFCTFRDLAHEIVVRWPDRVDRELDVKLVEPHEVGHPSRGTRGQAASVEAELARRNAVLSHDLPRLAAKILTRDPDVLRALRNLRRNVLVDDLQNASTADVELLRLICPPGSALFATGDPTQVIDRHRGCTGELLSCFEEAFGGTRVRLMGQHRATGGSALSASRRLRAVRRIVEPVTAAPVILTVSRDVDGEARAIRDGIERLRQGGVAYREQAVLARHHSTLGHLTVALDGLGVPLLHLGDFHAREDVLDHVALIELALNGDASNLERVACRAPYHVDPSLVARVRDASVKRGRALPKAMATLAKHSGGEGLSTLARHLSELPRASPHDVLAHWAFEREGSSAALFAGADLSRRLALVALHHLLVACAEHAAAGNSGTAGLRERLRTINSTERHGRFREVDLGASGLDAVHVLTFPAARGREFRAVHLAGMRELRKRLSPEDERAEDDLFRLAVTRAREHLTLHRSLSYPNRRTDPASRHLDKLAGVVVERRV